MKQKERRNILTIFFLYSFCIHKRLCGINHTLDRIYQFLCTITSISYNFFYYTFNCSRIERENRQSGLAIIKRHYSHFVFFILLFTFISINGASVKKYYFFVNWRLDYWFFWPISRIQPKKFIINSSEKSFNLLIKNNWY